MTSPSDPLRLTVVYERDEQGWTTATIPAVPRTVSAGRNHREARDNVLDALRELVRTGEVAGRSGARRRRRHARAGSKPRPRP